MLTKWKGLSKQVKIALGAGLACLAALGIGVAAWQPWNQKEPAEDLAPPPQQQEQTPQEKTEKGPTLKVGSEEIPCSIYTAADGWPLPCPRAGGPETGGTTAWYSHPRMGHSCLCWLLRAAAGLAAIS